MIGHSDIYREEHARFAARVRAEAAEAKAWPEGVIGRYLTVGQATVDLSTLTVIRPRIAELGEVEEEAVPVAMRAACTGCAAVVEESYTRLVRGTGSTWNEESPEKAIEAAREWAQAHAEKCRAMAVTR